MQKICSSEVIDLIQYSNGFIFAEKLPLLNDYKRYKVSYSVYDFNTHQIQKITKGAYLLNKFGSSYKQISEQLTNFVMCDTITLYDRRTLILYPTGEAGVFTKDGELSWSGEFLYHDNPVRSIAADRKYFWCVVPNENCILRYNSHNMKVGLRIGSKEATTFNKPEHISLSDGVFYVCCAGNGKVKAVDATNYAVKDYLRFDEPIRKFLKVGKNRIACLDSGMYIL